MIYGKYRYARNSAWRCLIDYNVTSLPVKILNIARRAGIRVIKNSIANELSEDEKGHSYSRDNELVIIYDDTDPKTVMRFTIAHELGHIFLGHNLENPTLSMENEANVFASRLLSPACVLWALDLHTPEEIAKICDISNKAAKIRAERMNILYERDKFLTSPLEKQVYENFEEFINRQKISPKSANSMEISDKSS